VIDVLRLRPNQFVLSCSFSKLPKNWAKDTGEVEASWRQTERALRATVNFVRSPITEHHVAVQRAGALVPRIDTALAEVQRCGTMNFSMPSTGATSARGRGFMSYGRARARLRQAIAGVIARGGVISRSLVAQVFE